MSDYLNYDSFNRVIPNNASRRFPIEWVIVFILFTIGIIILIVLLIKCQTDRLLPSQCPSVTGSYGLITSSNGTVLSSCGSDGKQPCSSTQTSLDAAVDECNSQSSICQIFSYNGSNNLFTVLVPQSTLFNELGTDVFTRQNDFIPNSQLS